MKFFQCSNEECPAHVPRNGRENHVLQSVQVLTPVDEDGRPVDDPRASKAVDFGYECGLCNMDVEELTPEKVVHCTITKVTPEIIFGEFLNDLRGDYLFHFALRIDDGSVVIKEQDEGFKPTSMEINRIQEYCREEYYENGIEVEITDVEQKDGRKVYYATVHNRARRESISVEASATEIIEEYGERPLVLIEKQKLLDVIRKAPY